MQWNNIASRTFPFEFDYFKLISTSYKCSLKQALLCHFRKFINLNCMSLGLGFFSIWRSFESESAVDIWQKMAYDHWYIGSSQYMQLKFVYKVQYEALLRIVVGLTWTARYTVSRWGFWLVWIPQTIWDESYWLLLMTVSLYI